MAVGKSVGDAQAIGVARLRVVGPVDLGGGLLIGEIERERVFQARREVYQLEIFAVVAAVFLETPAPYGSALVAEGDREQVGIDDQCRLDLLRGARDGWGGFGGTLLCRALRVGSLDHRRCRNRLRDRRRSGCGLLHFLDRRRRRRGFEEVGREEHHRAHQEEGEQQPHFHRHFFGRLVRVAAAVYRFGHADRFRYENRASPDGIETAGMKRMASHQAAQPHPHSPCRAITLDGFAHVIRTARIKAARRGQQRGDTKLVYAKRPH